MNFKKITKIALFSILGVYLMYKTYQSIEFDRLIEIGRDIKYQWVILAALAHLINHLIKAFRWKLLIEEEGVKVSTRHAFLGEMSGFLINLVPPRLGEWMRCVVLKRWTGIPITTSFAGVVIERAIELFLFLGLVFIGLGLDLATGDSVISSLLGQISFTISRNVILGGIALTLALVMVFFFFRDKVKKTWVGFKKHFFTHFVEALKKTRKKNLSLVWLSSIFIIVFQLLVEYWSFFAIDGIVIGLKGVFYVFIAMVLGMAAPTPGGIGAYHAGVIATLVILGIDREYAVVYAILTHTIQLFNATVVGGICLLISSFVKEKGEKKARVTPKG